MGALGVELRRLSLGALLIILALWWPFHSKKPQPTSKLTMEQQDERTAAGRCEKTDDLWFFMGPDDMIGMSHLSCGNAYRRWVQVHIDPAKMNRV